MNLTFSKLNKTLRIEGTYGAETVSATYFVDGTPTTESITLNAGEKASVSPDEDTDVTITDSNSNEYYLRFPANKNGWGNDEEFSLYWGWINE